MKRKAWAVMLAAYLGGLVIAMNQFKVPPVMQVLIDALHVDMATGGWLMSVFSVAGVVFALPAALLLARLGPKVSGLIALGCTLLGSIMGALAQEVSTMLASRLVEGIGLALIAVVAPAVISMWFEPQERGLPMGIWASWVPVGTFIMFNVANPIQHNFSWQGIWWFGAAITLIAFLVYAAVVDSPKRTEGTVGSQYGTPVSLTQGLASLNTWLLAVAFAGFNFSLVAYSTWVPSFMSQVYGIEPAVASFYASLPSLAVIPSGIFAGWVLDRVRNRKAVLGTALIVAVLILIWCFNLGNTSVIIPYMIGLGLVVGFIPSSTFTLAPETVPRPELAGMALAIVSLGQNFGMLIGPPLVGRTVAGGSWLSGTFPIVIATAIAVVAVLLIRIKTKANR